VPARFKCVVNVLILTPAPVGLGFSLIQKNNLIKGSPVHVAPACASSGEGTDHFRSYVRSLSLHFCKRLIPRLEPITSWSQGNNFTTVPRLPFYAQIPIQLHDIECIIKKDAFANMNRYWNKFQASSGLKAQC
jgi:hypothetical protein